MAVKKKLGVIKLNQKTENDRFALSSINCQSLVSVLIHWTRICQHDHLIFPDQKIDIPKVSGPPVFNQFSEHETIDFQTLFPNQHWWNYADKIMNIYSSKSQDCLTQNSQREGLLLFIYLQINES